MKSATEKMRKAMQHAETWVPWKKILRRDPCVYCCVWPMPQRDHDAFSQEHIQPRSAGGRNGWRNMANAHRSCNENRSSMPLLKYFLYRQQVRSLQGKQNKRARLQLRRSLGVGS